MGLTLGGGKTEKTALAVLEYYPKQNKIFLSRLFDRIRTEGENSGDLAVHQLIVQYPAKIESIAFDVPLNLPKCLRCRLECPGYEACTEPEIEWMWNYYRNRNKKKRPQKLFTPYTERCVDLFLSSELEEPFSPSHALGSNLAPLTARAFFINRRLKFDSIEVFPKLSLWRIGRSLQIQKSHLRFHKHSVGGEESRKAILEKLMDADIAFIYDQDFRLMVQNPSAFDAFVCALTGVLSFKGLCENRPSDFPKSAAWIAIPKEKLSWELGSE